jgi:endonuclease/exonuclease/phosphatase family metal-dependent hydrolase
MANLTTHVRIVNDTQWPITGTYKHVSGHTAGALPGEIPPHAVSRVLSATQTTLLHGAEGRYVLDIGVDAEDPHDRVLQFSECCSFRKAQVTNAGFGTWEGNYFHLEEVSPFIRVDARFGLGQPSGAADWGSTHLPANGHPLGIQLTITEQPPVDSLAFLTYNTHLFEGSNAMVGAGLKDVVEDLKPIVRETPDPIRIIYKDGERMQEVVRRINALTPIPDVVCLQEVWAVERQRELRDALLLTYPYVYVVPDAGFKGLFKDLRDAVANTSGLIVASRFYLRDVKFLMYTGAKKKMEDGLAKKGALAFRVRVPVSDRKAVDLRVGTTHAFTPPAQAQQNVEQLANLTFDGGKVEEPADDAVVLGDFNIHRNKEAEYASLLASMREWGADDIVEAMDPGDYTDWPAGNRLTAILDGTLPTFDPARKDRIDYVFFRPAAESHLRPADVQVFHDWTIADGVDVSDHAPVLARFEVVG